MEDEELLESGPIDYIVVEYAQHIPTGEAFEELLRLVDAGIVRVLDLAFVRKQDDGSVIAISWEDVVGEAPEIAVYEGASSGLLGQSDFDEVGNALEPNAAAAILVWENRWAAPFASAVRRSGGQLVASGRIPIQALLAELGIEE
ncbi:MAG TPA: DUF6325 family protein [Candidatus Nanopelagicales bacterium]